MFYLSKIVWAVLQPSSFIAILLLIGFFVSLRRKRIGFALLGAGAGLYLICGFSPLGNWLLIPLENRAGIGAAEPAEDAAGIIVLGGALAAGQKIGDTEKVLLNDAADRMVEALRVAQRYPGLPVIFSGGSGALWPRSGEATEADLAQKFFQAFNIAPPRLRLESRSRNTLENAVFTAEMLKPRSDQRWLLVTSAFHMPRARALFEAQGFRIIPRPGDFRVVAPEDRWRFFSAPSEGLRRVDLAAKEWTGLFASWFRGDINWPAGQEESGPVRSARSGPD